MKWSFGSFNFHLLEVLTGVNGGEMMVGGSRVDTAGAPVSPRISAPRVLEFRRRRGMPSPTRASVLVFLDALDDSILMNC